MRLTLRTLLAYRDGVLEPKDAAILEAKLRESPTARQISQRIDQSIGNPRLAPIPLDAREFGFDANQISEYLDDTISTEKIPEMERRCLENNALLSEVGSCHMILSRAISQSIEIPDLLRSRVHSLPTSPEARPNRLRIHRLGKDGKTIRIDNRSAAGASSEHNAKATTSSRLEQVTKPSMRSTAIEPRGSGIELSEGLGHQVPEYLLGSDRGRWKSVLMGTALLASLVAVGAFALGPIERIQEMLSLNQEPSKDKIEETDTTARNAKTLPNNESKESLLSEKSDKADIDKQSANGAIAPDADNNKNTDVSGDEPLSLSNSASKASGESPTSDVDEANKTSKQSKSETDATLSAQPNMAGKTSAEGGTRKASLQWLPESGETSSSVLFAEKADENGNPSWSQAKPGNTFLAATRVVVPPFQRTELRIEPGIRCVVAGETMIQSVENAESTTCFVPLGRLILFPTPDARKLVIDSNSFSLKLEFETLDSICAIEIGNRWKPASTEDISLGNVSLEPSFQAIGVQGTTRVTVSPRNNPDASFATKTEIMEIGTTVSLTNGAVRSPELLTDTPVWLRTSTENSIDQRASRSLQQALSKSTETDVRSTLTELVGSRLQETATLAARTMVLLEDYSGLVGENSILVRKGMFAHTSNWLPRLPGHFVNPGECKKFVSEIRSKNESRSDSLLRLMVPLTQKQLEEGGDKVLVEALSSMHPDEKSLAILQLESITGKTLGYHPERPSNDSILQWRKVLGKGEIRYAHAP